MYPDKAEAIVQKWADGHPEIKNIDKFAEIFGCDPIEINGLDATVLKNKCSWWMQEYEAPKEKESDAE